MGKTHAKAEDSTMMQAWLAEKRAEGPFFETVEKHTGNWVK